MEKRAAVSEIGCLSVLAFAVSVAVGCADDEGGASAWEFGESADAVSVTGEGGTGIAGSDAGTGNSNSGARDTGAVRRDTGSASNGGRGDVPVRSGEFTGCPLFTALERLVLVGSGEGPSCVVLYLVRGAGKSEGALSVEPERWDLERGGISTEADNCDAGEFNTLDETQHPPIRKAESITGSIKLGGPPRSPMGPASLDVTIEMESTSDAVPATQRVRDDEVPLRGPECSAE